MQQDQIIDCDGHLVEPPDLWQRYLEGELSAKAPRLVADRSGGTRIALEDRLYPQPEGNGKGFPGLPVEWFRRDEGGRFHAQPAISPQAIIIGLIAGVIAKFVTPGDNKPSGFISQLFSG